MEQNKIIKLFTGEKVQVKEREFTKILEMVGKSLENTLRELFERIPDKALQEIDYINKLYNNPSFSYVYLLYNNDTGLTKIGCTDNLLKRIKQIVSTFKNYTGIIPDLSLLGVILIHKDDMYKIEKILHDDYKQYRTYGEWYDINVRDVMYSNFIDSSENSIIIKGTYVCVGEYDEYQCFQDVDRNYTLSINDLEKAFDMNLYKHEDFINYNINKNKCNRLLDILLTMVKHNIGFKIPISYIVDDILLENELIFANREKNDIQTISKIKRNNFNKEDVESTINYLNDIRN